MSRTPSSGLVVHAFGDRPGDFPLPVPRGREELWMYAVTLGGQGRYAAARTALTEVLLAAGPGAVASLATSTHASLLRQMGWHGRASALDGRALAMLPPVERVGEADDPALVTAARCDAITGLAADALGCGRLALGNRLLQRCRVDLEEYDARFGSTVLWRQHVRLHWVGAELALASGDFDVAARHARTASKIADGSGSVRHRVKSDLLRAATLTGVSDTGPAVELAEDVLARADRFGLVPLKWAASMLLAGVTSNSSWAAQRDDCEARIVRWGGRFRP